MEGMGDSCARGRSAVAMVNVVEEGSCKYRTMKERTRGINIVKDQLLREGWNSDLTRTNSI